MDRYRQKRAQQAKEREQKERAEAQRRAAEQQAANSVEEITKNPKLWGRIFYEHTLKLEGPRFVVVDSIQKMFLMPRSMIERAPQGNDVSEEVLARALFSSTSKYTSPVRTIALFIKCVSNPSIDMAMKLQDLADLDPEAIETFDPEKIGKDAVSLARAVVHSSTNVRPAASDQQFNPLKTKLVLKFKNPAEPFSMPPKKLLAALSEASDAVKGEGDVADLRRLLFDLAARFLAAESGQPADKYDPDVKTEQADSKEADAPSFVVAKWAAAALAPALKEVHTIALDHRGSFWWSCASVRELLTNVRRVANLDYDHVGDDGADDPGKAIRLEQLIQKPGGPRRVHGVEELQIRNQMIQGDAMWSNLAKLDLMKSNPSHSRVLSLLKLVNSIRNCGGRLRSLSTPELRLSGFQADTRTNTRQLHEATHEVIRDIEEWTMKGTRSNSNYKEVVEANITNRNKGKKFREKQFKWSMISMPDIRKLHFKELAEVDPIYELRSILRNPTPHIRDSAGLTTLIIDRSICNEELRLTMDDFPPTLTYLKLHSGTNDDQRSKIKVRVPATRTEMRRLKHVDLSLMFFPPIDNATPYSVYTPELKSLALAGDSSRALLTFDTASTSPAPGTAIDLTRLDGVESVKSTGVAIKPLSDNGPGTVPSSIRRVEVRALGKAGAVPRQLVGLPGLRWLTMDAPYGVTAADIAQSVAVAELTGFDLSTATFTPQYLHASQCMAIPDTMGPNLRTLCLSNTVLPASLQGVQELDIASYPGRLNLADLNGADLDRLSVSKSAVTCDSDSTIRVHTVEFDPTTTVELHVTPFLPNVQVASVGAPSQLAVIIGKHELMVREFDRVSLSYKKAAMELTAAKAELAANPYFTAAQTRLRDAQLAYDDAMAKQQTDARYQHAKEAYDAVFKSGDDPRPLRVLSVDFKGHADPTQHYVATDTLPRGLTRLELSGVYLRPIRELEKKKNSDSYFETFNRDEAVAETRPRVVPELWFPDMKRFSLEIEDEVFPRPVDAIDNEWKFKLQKITRDTLRETSSLLRQLTTVRDLRIIAPHPKMSNDTHADAPIETRSWYSNQGIDLSALARRASRSGVSQKDMLVWMTSLTSLELKAPFAILEEGVHCPYLVWMKIALPSINTRDILGRRQRSTQEEDNHGAAKLQFARSVLRVPQSSKTWAIGQGIKMNDFVLLADTSPQLKYEYVDFGGEIHDGRRRAVDLKWEGAWEEDVKREPM
ncbi:hypothetical protein J8273_2071 [Carpediemonas membranifera]|uniref:Uncharacterized protein n=1 Tax=Carpediemonas membranifera TaxID=201153 RepID=A0A8J6EB59_9EUKA|nr:hypothetical protein J8273_2071 [Carpediemonas membranifera]|eukprot:KAG9396340.1 hypothetical protein J8273_2071 [Carpediemonas membranifera]